MSSLVVALWLAGVALLLLSWWLRRRSGVPLGDIVYSDTDAPAEPLISHRYGLVGKPDYVVLRRGAPLPIEIKPNRVADRPYEGDRLQIAAYCLLIEETSAKTPAFGVLKYRDRTFRVDYDARLRGKLLSTLDEMRACLSAEDVGRSHASEARCAGCGFGMTCEESLAR